MNRLLVSILAVMLLPLPQALIAGDGTIPIWEPTTINESGSYVLIRDIRSDPGPTITVLADDVEIDLNGFTVAGGIVVSGTSESEEGTFLIENGKIIMSSTGWPGVEIERSGINATVRNLRVMGRGIILNDIRYGVAEDNLVQNGTIDLEVTGGIVRKNFIGNSPGEGIGIESCGGCEIVGNVIRFAGTTGINAIGCGSCRIAENTVTSSGEHGLLVSGYDNQIEKNVLTANSGYGLFFWAFDGDNVYRGNTARGNAGTGCTGAASGGDFCDEGTDNTSHGDNYMPGKM